MSGDTSPHLLDKLRKLGDDYGPLGVARAAASLTDVGVLISSLGVLTVTVERASSDPGAVMAWSARIAWPARESIVGLGATIPDALRDVAAGIEHYAVDEAVAGWLDRSRLTESEALPTSPPAVESEPTVPDLLGALERSVNDAKAARRKAKAESEAT